MSAVSECVDMLLPPQFASGTSHKLSKSIRAASVPQSAGRVRRSDPGVTPKRSPSNGGD
jgi:hypothetical protein